MTSEAMLTAAQTAARLKISERTLRRLRDRGEGPPFRREPDGQLLYSSAGLDQWLSTQCIVSIIYAPVSRGMMAA